MGRVRISDFQFPIFDFGNAGQNDWTNAQWNLPSFAVLESMVCGVEVEFIE